MIKALSVEALLLKHNFSQRQLEAILKKPGINEFDESIQELHRFYRPVYENIVLYTRVYEQLLSKKIELYKYKENTKLNFIEVYIQYKVCAYEYESIFISLISAWIVIALNYGFSEVRLDANFFWKNRHSVITVIENLVHNFLIKVGYSYTGSHSLSISTKNMLFLALQILISSGVLQTKLIFVSKNKSEVYIRCSELALWINSNAIFDCYSKPMELIHYNNDVYTIANHYSSVSRLLRKNKNNKKPPVMADLSFILSRLGLKVLVRWRLYEAILKYIYTLYKDDFDSISSYLDHLSKLKLNFWCKQSQKKYSKLYNLKYFLLLRDHKHIFTEGIYFNYYFDFRGRVYADSPISYTNNRLTRAIFYYGIYTDSELDSISFYSDFGCVNTLNYILSNSLLMERHKKIKLDSRIHIYYIMVLFFEIGKLFKNEELSVKNNKMSFRDFVELGVKKYNTISFSDYSLNTVAEYLALTDLFTDIEEDIYLKVPIYKDATASAIQILCLLLGAKSMDFYKECNLLHAGFWYDTYSCIIYRFEGWANIPINIREKYFTRKALKKTIMTHNYAASLKTCWHQFCLENELSFEDGVSDEVFPFFKGFYMYLNKIFNSTMYFLQPSKKIVNEFKQLWGEKKRLNFTTLDNLVIPLEYYKPSKKRVEKIVMNKRETIVWKYVSNDVDDVKMFRALRANIIHSFDGYLIRSVSKSLGYPIITIHDSFGIDILNINRLTEAMHKELTLLSQVYIVSDNDKIKPSIKVTSEFVLL